MGYELTLKDLVLEDIQVLNSLLFLFRAKMKNGEYESVEQMDADLTLMFENAKRYNMPNSSIYKRAFRLQQIMQVMTSASCCVSLC